LKKIFNSSRGAQIICGSSPGGLYFLQQCLDFGGTSVWNFLHGKKQASRILRGLLDFLKLCASMNGIVQSLHPAMSNAISPKLIFNTLTF